jgi:hypothetical protein
MNLVARSSLHDAREQALDLSIKRFRSEEDVLFAVSNAIAESLTNAPANLTINVE